MRVTSFFTFLFAAIATETVGAQGIFRGRNNGNRVRALVEEVSMSADLSLSLSFGGIGHHADPEPSGKSGKGSSMMSMGKSGKGSSVKSMGKSGKVGTLPPGTPPPVVSTLTTSTPPPVGTLPPGTPPPVVSTLPTSTPPPVIDTLAPTTLQAPA